MSASSAMYAKCYMLYRFKASQKVLYFHIIYHNAQTSVLPIN